MTLLTHQWGLHLKVLPLCVCFWYGCCRNDRMWTKERSLANWTDLPIYLSDQQETCNQHICSKTSLQATWRSTFCRADQCCACEAFIGLLPHGVNVCRFAECLQFGQRQGKADWQIFELGSFAASRGGASSAHKEGNPFLLKIYNWGVCWKCKWSILAVLHAERLKSPKVCGIPLDPQMWVTTVQPAAHSKLASSIFSWCQ